MNNFTKMAIAAVVVIVVGAVGLSLLRPSTPSGVGGQAGASPSASASASPTPGTSPSDSPVSPPALTGTYTSDRNGFTISYPTGWVTRPATDAWTTNLPDFVSTAGDVIYDPVLQDHLWIMVASQSLPDGKTAAQWVDDLLVAAGCDAPPGPVTIDGNQGQHCGSLAAVAAGGRGYAIALYTSGDDPAVVAPYDQAYFDEILATLRLQPQDAVDTVPSTSP